MPAKKGATKIGTFGLISKFKGFDAKEDKTTLTPDFLVTPSRNVLIESSGRVSSVAGYILDGIGSTAIDSGILSNFDFTNFKGDVRNMRAGFLTSAANDGKLQYRYVTGTSTVNWVDLKTGLTNVRLCYTEYWDNTNLVKDVLWVDGSNNIFVWNGAVTTLASATATTITKQGANTWAQEGFAQTGTRSIVIGGVVATYTGGEGTTTLTGVSVDFSASTAGSIVHQAVTTTTLVSMTSILATFAPTVIGCGRRNQVYLGTSSSNNLYISKVNSYTDYSFTLPVRIVGEGALIPLDAPPTKFIPQEVRDTTDAYDMYISEGLSTWAVIRATLSSDLTKEFLEHIRLKVSPLQGSLSERLATKMKNHIMFVDNSKTVNLFGYMSYQYVPAINDISYSIVNDMNSYDFTDGSIFYHRNYIYVAIPKMGLMRVYNMADQTQEQYSGLKAMEDVTQEPWFWEAPITYPLSGFYVVNGELYGHSYTTSESYKLFTGGSFNGQDIEANATFAYDDKGDRSQKKGSNEVWIEGYISQNTTLNCDVIGDMNAFMTSQTVTVKGNDNTIVAYGGGGNSLGDSPLGIQTLGGATTTTSTTSLPAWFHTAKTYVQKPCYLEQLSFYTKGVDLNWKLIAFGTNATFTNEGINDIKQ